MQGWELLVPQKCAVCLSLLLASTEKQNQDEAQNRPRAAVTQRELPTPLVHRVDIRRKQLPTKITAFTPFCYTEWFNGTFTEKQESSGPKSA